MKKRDVYISIAILAVVALGFLFLDNRTGEVRLDAPGMKLTLRSGFFTSVTIQGDNQPVRIKARRYHPAYLSLEKGDYQALGSHSFGDLSQIYVKSGESLSLTAGPPLTLQAVVRHNPSISTASIDYVLHGRAGEQYQYVMKGNSRILASDVTIVSEAGDTLASGKLEYG